MATETQVQLSDEDIATLEGAIDDSTQAILLDNYGPSLGNMIAQYSTTYIPEAYYDAIKEDATDEIGSDYDNVDEFIENTVQDQAYMENKLNNFLDTDTIKDDLVSELNVMKDQNPDWAKVDNGWFIQSAYRLRLDQFNTALDNFDQFMEEELPDYVDHMEEG